MRFASMLFPVTPDHSHRNMRESCMRTLLRFASAARTCPGLRVPAGLAEIAGLQRVATGLTAPMFVTHAPNDPNRLFIAERGGAIRILNLNTGVLQPTPFLIDDRHQYRGRRRISRPGISSGLLHRRHARIRQVLCQRHDGWFAADELAFASFKFPQPTRTWPIPVRSAKS